MSDENTQNRSAFERHAQTIVQVIIAGLCLWMAKTTTETSTEVAVMSVQMNALQADIEEVKESSHRSYSIADANRDREALNRRIDALEVRVHDLEVAQ